MTEAEKEFHKSRLMWAFVDGKIYWTFSELGHRKWLETQIKAFNFDNITRGYIKATDNVDIVNIVAYKANFESVYLTWKQYYTLIWLANLNYSFKELHIYNHGLTPGEIGETWKPIGSPEIVDYNEKIEIGTCSYISLYKLLMYEDYIKELLSRNNNRLSERSRITMEHEKLLKYIRTYSNTNELNSTTLQNVRLYDRIRREEQ